MLKIKQISMKYLCFILWIAQIGFTSAHDTKFCGEKRKFSSNGGSLRFNFNSSNSQNVFCEWDIKVEKGKVVELQLQNNAASYCLYLSWDALADALIIDGSSCHNRKERNQIISSSTNKIKVIYDMFTSTHAQVKQFDVIFKAVELNEAVNRYADCGQSLTGVSGTFTSPGFPIGYKPLLKCKWTIIPEKNNDFIEIKFRNSSLESGCDNDFVKLYDDEGKHIGSLCSTSAVRSRFTTRYTTNGKNTTIVFISDESVTDIGFSAYYSTKQEAIIPPKKGCVKTFKRFQKMIASPGFPNNYPNGLTCIWTLNPLPNYNAIEMIVLAFDLEQHPTCQYDKLTLSERLDGWNLCGKETLSKFKVTGRRPLTLTFTTDKSVGRSGFKAFYRLTDCGGKLTDNTGTFTSPNYPHRYPELMKCTWEITVESGLFVEIRFTNFSLSAVSRNTHTCDSENDYIEVYIGANNTLVGRYCDLKIPDVISSPDNKMKVVFVSDDLSDSYSKGFFATYQATKTQRIPEMNNYTNIDCGGKLTAKSGTFTSPGYPNNYPPNVTCVWIIDPEKKKRNSYIEVTLNDLMLESGHSVCRDSVKGFSSRSICKLEEEEDKFPYLYVETSETPYTITFTSDDIIQERGFSASYKLINLPCGGDLIADEGNIISPNFKKFLPEDLKCTWSITVPKGKVVRLQIHKIASKFSINLAIFTGPEKTFLNNYGNLKHPEYIWSPNNKMTVEFVSKRERTMGNEFNATFQARDPSELPEKNERVIVLTNRSGIISPNYKFNMNYTWIIKAKKDSVINLDFKVFDLEWSLDCMYDYVLIIQSDSVKRYCGNRRAFSLRTDDNTLILMFITDDSENDRGFTVEYAVTSIKSIIMDRLEPRGRYWYKYGSISRGSGSEFESQRRNNLALEHFRRVSNTSSTLKMKELLPIIFQNIKLIVKHLGYSLERTNQFGFPRVYEAIDELFDTLLLLTAQESFREVKAKDKETKSLFNAVRTAAFSALQFIHDVKKLWSGISHTDFHDVDINVPHVEAANLLTAAVSLADILLDNMYLLGGERYAHGSICELRKSGKNCFMDTVEEIKALTDYLVEIGKLRHQSYKLFYDNVWSSLNRVGEIQNILNNVL